MNDRKYLGLRATACYLGWFILCFIGAFTALCLWF